MAIHLIAVALTTWNSPMCQIDWLWCKERKKKGGGGGTQEPKCHHSIKGDSDSFWLLMASEVVATAAKESCHYSYWKSMFDASVDNNFSQA